MGFMDDLNRLLARDDTIDHETTSKESLLTELKKCVQRIGSGYSPLRRFVVYEIYRFLLREHGKPPIQDFFDQMNQFYQYHRERLAAPFSDLNKILVPIPYSREEVELQMLSLDEDLFNPPTDDYKGVVCIEIEPEKYPAVISNQGYNLDYVISTETGPICIDNSLNLISSHKGDGRHLVVFALPDKEGSAYHATYAVWKQFYEELSPLQKTEDIYLAIYEYSRSGMDIQSFIDDYELIHEFALEIAFFGSIIEEHNIFSFIKEQLSNPIREHWHAFNGAKLLVDDVLFHIAAWLGYLRNGQQFPLVYDETPKDYVYDFETFPMKCEYQTLSRLAKLNGADILQS